MGSASTFSRLNSRWAHRSCASTSNSRTANGRVWRRIVRMLATKINRTAVVGALLALVIGGLPAAASGGGSATLYELTENMRLDNLSKPTLRTASAALQGTSVVGSPLCPAVLMGLLSMVGLPSGSTCTLTAFGEDGISLAGGNGSFTGAFAVVVNLDNAVAAPEFVVMT